MGLDNNLGGSFKAALQTAIMANETMFEHETQESVAHPNGLTKYIKRFGAASDTIIADNGDIIVTDSGDSLATDDRVGLPVYPYVWDAIIGDVETVTVGQPDNSVLSSIYTGACSPTETQLSDFLYDDEHYVVVFAGQIVVNVWDPGVGYAWILRAYFYGSDDSATSAAYTGNAVAHGDVFLVPGFASTDPLFSNSNFVGYAVNYGGGQSSAPGWAVATGAAATLHADVLAGSTPDYQTMNVENLFTYTKSCTTAWAGGSQPFAPSAIRYKQTNNISHSDLGATEPHNAYINAYTILNTTYDGNTYPLPISVGIYPIKKL